MDPAQMMPPSRRAKRPNALYGAQATVYLDDEMDAAVRDYARRSRVRLAVALRELISFGLEGVKDA